jgi:SPP1 gp7 family putative phage head morphogenesis protein
MPVNANTQIYDKTIDRAAMIRLYERRVSGKVELVLDGHKVRLDKLIQEAQLSGKGFERFREAVDQELRKTFKEVYNTTKRSLIDLALDQVSYTYQNLEATMGRIWNAERPAKRIAEEIVLKKPLHQNKTLEAGWYGVSTAEKKRIEGLIRKGIAEKKTLNEIALSVRKGNIHKITMQQSKALVVTAVTSVTAQADHEVYMANEKVLAGWQYVAVLDSRTTPLCAHRDGTIYPVNDTEHLPPAHYYCRSTTIPVFNSWEDLVKLEGVAQIRKTNLRKLSPKQKAFYDGQTPMRESYQTWLMRQPKEVQLRHLGEHEKVELFRNGQLELKQFTNPEGNSIGIKELRALTDNGYVLPGDTRRFAIAKEKLDALPLGVSRPEDLFDNDDLAKNLIEYYKLQAGDLNGTLSLTNYRGMLLHTKKATKQRVLTSPPKEEQLVFNPFTRRYDDIRIYQPKPNVYNNNIRLINEEPLLKAADKEFILKTLKGLEDYMSINERAVVADNLRIIFTRYRRNPESWQNFKAVLNNQIKFDVMNVSDAVETQLRKDADVLKKLQIPAYIDPVLGPTTLQELSDSFIDNIIARNDWEDRVAPKIAKQLKQVFDREILTYNPIIWERISERDMQQFYLRFAHRLSLADFPDRDTFAVTLGRDLYNLANLNGSRNKWYNLGLKILESPNAKKFYKLDTYGVQKRRMKSRMSGKYFGPYYDTLSYYITITDPKILKYAELTRKVEFGLRIGVTNPKNRLIVREGYKTYWIDRGILGLEDTRIPITSTSSFGDFPSEFIDKEFVNALNWAAKAEYRIDNDFYDAINKLLYFEDDKGKAKYYNDLNTLRKYLASRGDSYERFKAMSWFRSTSQSFSNHPFIDHRARIYERGLIGPQAGETFRPFLNTSFEKNFSPQDFYNFQDQVGSFLGGLSDYFEGRFNSLTFSGRQKIAEKWRPELIKIGNHLLRGKPNDLRAVLESDIFGRIDGEELTKFLRLALETAKFDNYLGGNYTKKSLEKLFEYKTALALEQDASSSGAQIIALTTRNKQLAELSNVVPTTYKKRLYDEIAAATYNDPRFRKLNERLGLTEKDLRKAAKAQNMVTFYGAGERTGTLNVEGKLAKVLEKEDGTLVVKTADRDIILNEISARMARYEKIDPVLYEELSLLRQNVKDIFNKGSQPGQEIMDQLFFLDSKTQDLLEKMSLHYEKVVTPDDFKNIAAIMSEHLGEQVPILKDFTRYLGRLAEDYLLNAKPANADFDWKSIAKITLRGSKEKGYVLPDWVSRLFGLKAGEPVSEKILKRLPFWNPNGTLHEMIYGINTPETRRTGAKYFKTSIIVPTIDLKKAALLKEVNVIEGIELFTANKLPKSWTNIPWVNFDGKIVEQNFTQTFEERLNYKDKLGNWVKNIISVPQRTEADWKDQLINKSGKINDIADITKARTAFAVNGNHSNDAVIVKKFHLWGLENKVPTATVHDAFFTNAADMLKARKALREIYAKVLEKNVIKATLDEMLARGLPKEIYDKYLEEAIERGLIPVVGKSRINGRLLKESDILMREDVLKEIPDSFFEDFGWYGVN